MVNSTRRELFAFSVVLAAIVGGFFADSLIVGRVLSPADVLFASKSFREVGGATYEPANRLLIDPVLQFQPWLEFNRSMIRSGRLPLWNSSSGCGAPHLANGQSAVFDPFQVIAYLGELPRMPWPGWRRPGSGLRAWDVPARPSLGLRTLGTLVRGSGLPVLRVPGRLVAIPGHERRDLDALGLPGDRAGLAVPGARSVGWLALAVGGPRSAGTSQTSGPRPARGGSLLVLASLANPTRGVEA